MKRVDAVRSLPPTAIDVTSMRDHSSGRRRAAAGPDPLDSSALSRMNVDRAFFHAFQYR